MATIDARGEALATLDNVLTINRNEMVVSGYGYVSQDVERPGLSASGAICGGRYACLVGALWIAHGTEPERDPCIGGTWLYLPGVDECDRDEYLAERPGLKAAYDAVNLIAGRWLDGINFDQEWEWQSAAEVLFEQAPDACRDALMDRMDTEPSIDTPALARLMVEHVVNEARTVVSQR